MYISFYKCDQIWQNFATSAKVYVFGKFSTVYFICGKILSLIWQICDIIGLICILANGQILKNNLTIWSHWFLSIPHRSILKSFCHNWLATTSSFSYSHYLGRCPNFLLYSASIGICFITPLFELFSILRPRPAIKLAQQGHSTIQSGLFDSTCMDSNIAILNEKLEQPSFWLQPKAKQSKELLELLNSWFQKLSY